MSILGAALLVVVIAVVILSAVAIWGRPALGLPILVAGLAAHNAALMVLIQAGTPETLVRVVQAWKEILLVVLGLRLVTLAASSGIRGYLGERLAQWRRFPLGVRIIDVTALAFGAVLAVYLLIPSSLLPSPAPTVAQRLVSFRMFALIPALYVMGRVWAPTSMPDRRWVVTAIVGTAAAVAVLGLVELWFVPTRTWVTWGIVQFDSFLGFQYQGPGGLPENFFQSTSGGLALRRMVSTYLSPLGIAYTGLLVVPLALVGAMWTRRRTLAWAAFSLVIIGISLSLTRLALLCLVGEAIALAVAFRRPTVYVATAATIAAVAAAFLIYPNYGPVVGFDLADVRPPAGIALVDAAVRSVDVSVGSPPGPTATPGVATPGVAPPANMSTDVVNRLLTAEDASVQGHIRALDDGLRFVAGHPLGVGLGASVPRFGTASAPAESALFQVGAETGVVGMALFVILYAEVVLAGWLCTWRLSRDDGRAGLCAVVGIGGLALAPIVLTSQIWGDFSVTFMFWWAAGAAVSVFAASRAGAIPGSAISETVENPVGPAGQRS
jgi:hypothetical protein